MTFPGFWHFLPLSRLFIFDDFRHGAVYDKAKRINGFRGDRFAFFHAVQRVCGYAVLKDQRILRHAFFIKRVIKWLIRNQMLHLISDESLSLGKAFQMIIRMLEKIAYRLF